MSDENNLFGHGAEQLARLAVIWRINPYDAIDELARRIENRRVQGRPDNPVAVRVCEQLSCLFDYKPLRPQVRR